MALSHTVQALLLFILPSIVHAQFRTDVTRPYITQMHIHGWSNHNGDPKPGSLQYHNWQAGKAGVDVLWWTEHHQIFEQQTYPLSFAGASVEPSTLDITGIPFSSGTEYSHWKCLRREGNCSAGLTGDTLLLGLQQTQGGGDWETFSYAPRSQKGLIRQNNYVKPVASRPKLSFRMNPVSSHSTDTRLRILFRLAWHHRSREGQDIVVFRLDPSATTYSIASNQNDSVFVVVPVQAGWQNYELDVFSAASMLLHGTDNTLSDIEVQLMARNNAVITTGFHDFELTPGLTDPDSLVREETAYMHTYNSAGNTHNIFGIEYSGSLHANAFFRNTSVTDSLFRNLSGLTVPEWVAAVHNAGGLVSYNHMFGTTWDAAPAAEQEFRTDTMADYLLRHQAFGADILEVGYASRGGCDLAHHLDVWDKLTVNGLFLYGNGVSDSHGGMWMGQSSVYHTWIYADGNSEEELLSALSRGKMCFGNLSLFSGDFWYRIGNLEPGDRGFVQDNFIAPDFHLKGAPPGSKIRITQGLLDAEPEVTYIYRDHELDLNALPLIDCSRPSFVRFGVYDAHGSPLIFGQPVVIFGTLNDTSGTGEQGRVQALLYPNPASEHLFLSLTVHTPEKLSLHILDAGGRLIEVIAERYFYMGKYGFALPSRSLHPGVYMLEITGGHTNLIRQFVIQ